MNLQTNLIGRRGTAEIWTDVHTPVEIVAAFLDGHTKYVSVRLLVKVIEAGPIAKLRTLHTVNAERCIIQ